jgi:tetratricopeptide (TPR) repeat protein
MQSDGDTAPAPERRWQIRVLAALAALMLPGFLLTASVTRAYHGRVESLASDYVARADDVAAHGRWGEAIDAYQAAIALGHDSPTVRLRLAQALARAGRADQARSYLLSLRDATPGDALVNLELARLAAAGDDPNAALRYYRDAIDGAWAETPQRHRRETRLELAAYLARRGENARSQAELLPLTSELPQEASTRVRVAQLLADTGSPAKAFEMFRAALALEPSNAAAVAGAGHAAFALSNYRTAHRYLSRASALNPDDRDVREQLTLVEAIIDLDPFTRGLSRTERAARVNQALDLAVTQAVACPGSVEPESNQHEGHEAITSGSSRASASTGQNSKVERPSPETASAPERSTAPTMADLRAAQRLWQSHRAQTSDALDTAMELVFAVADRAADRCGPLQGRELALQLIGRERRASER